MTCIAVAVAIVALASAIAVAAYRRAYARGRRQGLEDAGALILNPSEEEDTV
ncbi:hypothetical protein ACNJYD_19995 [Bradyrhizobium sp. DASA03005]|uniref:hypothetical protein n=1 Tax=Bradyrhizobium sp. SPXBL-02 TaxID=3395912 RepID=UPI003F721FBE